MTPSSKPRRMFRFQDFELDLVAYELRRHGRRVRLERRPMDLLILMVERRGELVTRGEIVERLWGNDVFIEVETAVNTLVRKIRQALHDSSEAPTFVETVQGKGYRFISPVEILTGPAAPLDALGTDDTLPPNPAAGDTASDAATDVPPAAGDGRERGNRWRRLSTAIALAAIVSVAAVGAWRWNAARQAPTHVRLAVLPFETIRVDPGREYLEDALHEETIAALGQVDPERIEVITRRQMLGYKQTTKPLGQIAQELGVEYLVGSSIHEENGLIRVTATLIRARDQVDIWSRSYDNEPGSILDFQRALSVRIADEIRYRVSPDRLSALARRHTTNSEAFQLYLQGLAAWNQLKPPLTTQRAIEYYTRATQADPGYALPWTGLALAYAGAPINGDADPRLMGPLARRTAERALAADAQLAEAQTAMGAVNFWFDWDWASAEAMFRKAIAADPNYAFGRRMLGILLSHQGRHDEAQEHMRRLLKLEPTYEMNWTLRSQVAINAGEYPAAVEFAKQAAVFQPNFWIADFHLATAYEQLGQHDRALEVLDRQLSAGANNSKLHSLRGYLLAKIGRRSEALDALKMLEQASRARYVPPYAHALVHAGLNDRTAALDSLERGYEQRDVHLIALCTDAKWNAYRKDRRFIPLLQHCSVRPQS